jgi:ABC-type transporter MlaC component
MFTIITESKDVNLDFKKKPKASGKKTDVYDVIKDGVQIGQIKWSSRLRGYGFLPTSDCEPSIKDFIKDLMSKRREDKKKNKG